MRRANQTGLDQAGNGAGNTVIDVNCQIKNPHDLYRFFSKKKNSIFSLMVKAKSLVGVTWLLFIY